jgi:hypothetical protein
VLVAGVVAAVVLLAVAVGVMVTSGDDGGDDLAVERPSTTAPDTTVPGETPSLPSLPLDPSVPGTDDPDPSARPLAEVLPDIIEFVEETRGHEFVTEPVVQALPEQEFEERFTAVQQSEADTLQVEQTALRATGIIYPDTDLLDASTQAGVGGVLGFYQPATGELLVKGDVVTPLVRAVIAHELTHALDDQHFDLSRLDAFSEQPDESAFGLLSVVEGTARWVETQFRDQMSTDDQVALEREELELGLDQTETMLDLPLPLLVQSAVPYTVGAALVEAVVIEGGLDLLDSTFEQPPTTSEQVLDPAVLLARQPATAVPAPEPGAGGSPVSSGAFGAVDLRMLEIVGDPAGAFSAFDGSLLPVDGFGGGRYVSWTSSTGDDCITIHVVGDAGRGAAEVARILDEWAPAVGAQVTTAFGMQVATSCV